MSYPRMVTVEQQFDAPKLNDVALTVRTEVRRILPDTPLKAGDTVAVTVGSRGITNLSTIIKTIVDELVAYGCRPFIVPCMGSHGGATPEGQRQVLEHYGISESTMGVPVKSSMEVECVGKTEDGLDVFVDKNVLSADHIVLFNRVKPHTDFRGPIESGLMKMMTIGIGKHHGAHYYHQAAVTYGGSRVIQTVGRAVIKNCRVAFGVASVENAYDETAIIEAILPGDIERREAQLLEESRRLMAKLPFDIMDVLVIDRIGKNISGTGMDTNIVGRIMNIYTPDPPLPKITRIVARDITPESEGNAIGIGMADFITKRLYDKINFEFTATNCVTALLSEKARVPIVAKTDKELVDLALTTIGLVKPENAKVIWIKDTLSLKRVAVSEAFLGEARKRPDLKILGEPWDLSFDEAGNLKEF